MTSFYTLPLFLSLFLFLLPYGNAVSFQLPRFRTDSNILYEGDAALSVGAVELINKYKYNCRVGRAIYADRVRLWDSDSGKLSDFSTHFSFSIDTLGSSHYGHGLAFFLAPVGFQTPLNSAGGFLGLFNTTNSDSHLNRIITIEFDSFPNEQWDPPYEHVGINNNSIASAITARWNASLHSGDTANAYIVYNATTKNLSVFWNYGENSSLSGNSSLSYHIDLMKVLPEWVNIGFSAATGQYVQRHTLYSWDYSSTLDKKATNEHDARNIKLIVGIVVPIGIFIFGIIVGILILLRRGRKIKERVDKETLTSLNVDIERVGPKRFSYAQLVLATNNFSNERKLGQGGFGCVYKGYLTDIDMAVAVKKISRGSRQGKKEYITEVKVISQLRHRNLVQLIGWCHDRGEFLLIYEFMPNGSLDTHLFGKKRFLTWEVRYRIALGLASALVYLHEEWERCVVHRDVKSSNIMLDSSFNVKLGDFGLARLMDHELGPQTTGLAGTLGYMAPEYIATGRASKESDVYSFGVVALEIASGRKSGNQTEESEVGLVKWVWDLYGRGQLLSAVDTKLHMNFDAKQLDCLMKVGLWCAHPDSSLRPSIRQAVQVLIFEAALPSLPLHMPVPLYMMPVHTISSDTPSEICTSLDIGR